MKLFELLTNEAEIPGIDILFAAIVAGVSNTTILIIINTAIQTPVTSTSHFRYLLMFAVIMVLYIISLKYTYEQITSIFEKAINNIRVRIVNKIRNCELSNLEKVGKSRLYSQINQEITTISQAQNLLITSMQGAIVFCFITIYIAYLSSLAFFFTMIFVFVGISIYLYREKEATRYIQRSTEEEVRFYSLISGMIDGFKEIKLDRKKNDALFKDIQAISNNVEELRIKASNIYNANYMYSQHFFYFLLAIMVFLLPKIVETYSDVMMQITAAILFLIRPLSAMVVSVPIFARTNIAAENLYKIEMILVSNVTEEVSQQVVPHNFEFIELKDLGFSYYTPHEIPFQVGPLNLKIKSNETLFVIGGNGSGKSTFLKLLTALYLPTNGTISIDNIIINKHNIFNYRELFSTIFSDFHLFEKIYGTSFNQDRVSDLLELTKLTNKTNFNNGQFSNINLSTGQKKRLALVITLLEDKPIYVFDEWAAEQDPSYREYFYKNLLPYLKNRGKTIIAITHDDKYFQEADRIVKMNYGKLEDFQVLT